MVGRAGCLGFASPYGPLLTQRYPSRSTSEFDVKLVGRAGFEPATN